MMKFVRKAHGRKSAAWAGDIHLAFENAQSVAAVPDVDRSNGFEAGTTIAREFADFDEMAASAPEWDQEYLKLGRESAGGRFEFAQTTRMQLGHETYRTGMLARGLIPAHSVAFVAHRSGSPVVHSGHTLANGEIAILTGGSEFECFVRGPSNLLIVCLNEQYLRDQGQVLASADFFASFSSHLYFRLSDSGHQGLRETMGRLIDLALSKPHLLTSPIAAKRMEEEIGSLLVSTATSLPDGGAPWVRHRAARRALDYIRANAEELFTIADLCSAIGASQRTLEIGFQELFGVPPKVYLTVLRLNRVRRELRSADSSSTSVTDAATHWGFYHFGRFAAAYRQTFGELPSSTLNRGKVLKIPDAVMGEAGAREALSFHQVSARSA